MSVVKQFLWIDQICKSLNYYLHLANGMSGINQSDIEERNSQITLMRRIYKSARQVVVWLGVDADESATAVEDIESIGRYIKRGPGEKSVEYPNLSMEQKQKNWKAVCAFYQRDWWQRSWVRQEVALARMPNMLCGNSSITYSTAIDAARYMGFVSGVLDGRNSTTMGSAGFGLPFGYHASQLAKLCGIVSSGDRFATLGEILMISRGSKATDPRDMVYAVLGMADPELYSLVPDYRSSVRDVYIAAAKQALLADRHGIKLLGACQNPERQNGLPSWTPNLTENWTTLPFEGNSIFRGIAWKPPTLKFEGETLLIQGYLSDEIECLSDMVKANDDGPQLDAILVKWNEAVGEASRNKQEVVFLGQGYHHQ